MDLLRLCLTARLDLHLFRFLAILVVDPLNKASVFLLYGLLVFGLLHYIAASTVCIDLLLVDDSRLFHTADIGMCPCDDSSTLRKHR